MDIVDVTVSIDNLFDKCRTLEAVEYLAEKLNGVVAMWQQERIYVLEEEENE
jgi:hypothetical protein